MMNIHTSLIIHEGYLHADALDPAHTPGVPNRACTLAVHQHVWNEPLSI